MCSVQLPARHINHHERQLPIAWVEPILTKAFTYYVYAWWFWALYTFAKDNASQSALKTVVNTLACIAVIVSVMQVYMEDLHPTYRHYATWSERFGYALYVFLLNGPALIIGAAGGHRKARQEDPHSALSVSRG